jgi:Glycosyl hydrolase family 12
VRKQPAFAAAALAALVPAVLALGVVLARPAAAAAPLCDPYATVDLGTYVVQNNRWGASSEQCVAVARTNPGDTGAGFRIVTSEAALPTDGAPAGYPSLIWGCHYGRCSDGFSPLPVGGEAVRRLRTSVSLSRVPDGDWDAAYDLWFDPGPRRDGHDAGAEIMVWLDHAGRPQPSGHRVGETTVEGRGYDVYVSEGRSRTITYVSHRRLVHAGFAVRSFVDNALARGFVERAWYLTSIQAGVEPWRGGAGLALSGFRVDT